MAQADPSSTAVVPGIQSSTEQVAAFLESDQLLFALLGQANELLFKLDQMEVDVPLRPISEREGYEAYLLLVDSTRRNFASRQDLLKSKMSLEDQATPAYFSLDGLTHYTEKAKDYLVEYYNWGLTTFGLGFVVTTTIVVIAIISASIIAVSISAALIADYMNDSSEERQDLLKATSDLCVQLNLSDEDCRALIKETLPESSGSTSFFGSLINPTTLLIGAVTIGVIYAGTRRK